MVCKILDKGWEEIQNSKLREDENTPVRNRKPLVNGSLKEKPVNCSGCQP